MADLYLVLSAYRSVQMVRRDYSDGQCDGDLALAYIGGVAIEPASKTVDDLRLKGS